MTLDALAEQLAATERRGLALLDAAGPDLAARRPPAGGWSALRCVAHLNATAEVSLALTEAALETSTPGATPEGYRVRWWVRLLARSMEPPARLKTRTRPVFVPPTEPDFGAVREVFLEGHRALRVQLATLAGHDLDRIRVRSPFAAYLRYSLYEWWVLLLAHERRHLWQAEEALKAAGGAILPPRGQ